MTVVVNETAASVTVARPERSGWVLLLIALFVLSLHVEGLMWLREPAPQPTASEAKPFKMEVNFLPGSTAETAKPAPQPVKPEAKTPPKPHPEKNPQKDAGKIPPPKQQAQADWAAVEKMIKTQPMKLVSRAVKSQPGSDTKQSVSAAMVQRPPKTPNARDNFPESLEHNPSPEYPEMALFLGYQGTAVMQIQVNGKGLSEGVKVLRSTGHKILDDSAAAAFKKWRFTATNHTDSVIIVVHYSLFD